jgi:hypothetical protein
MTPTPPIELTASFSEGQSYLSERLSGATLQRHQFAHPRSETTT